MRKTTQLAVEAFLSFKNMKLDNTQVSSEYDEKLGRHSSTMSLFGHDIAMLVSLLDDTSVMLCIRTDGYDTRTTAERLNGLPGVQVYFSKKNIYLNGVRWEDHALWREVPFTWKSCFYCGYRDCLLKDNRVCCSLMGVKERLDVCGRWKKRTLVISK